MIIPPSLNNIHQRKTSRRTVARSMNAEDTILRTVYNRLTGKSEGTAAVNPPVAHSEAAKIDTKVPPEGQDPQIRDSKGQPDKLGEIPKGFPRCGRECRQWRFMLFSNCEASNNRVVALESKVDSLEKLTAEQKKDIAEYKNAVEEKEQRIAYLNERIHRRNRTIDELTDAAAQQKLSIKDLTGAILRSTNIGTTTRGDDYFGGEFASLAGATRHWALRHFRGAPDVSYRDLPPVVHELLKPVFFEYDPTSDKKVSYKVIEAAAIQRISQNIFCSNFIFAIHRQPYPSVSKLLGGADIQKRKWHSQTIELVLQGDQFDACFGKGVDTVVEDLYSCFGGLAKAGSQEQCLKALRAVVEQAAKLEVEVCRQISVFKLKSITPGSEYDPSLMEDQSGLVDDAGEEGEDGQGFIVQLVYFPPVIRFQLDDAGNISESFVVVRKGTVVAAPKAEES